MPTKEKSQILESCLPLNYIAEEDSKLILPWVNSISNYLQDKRQVFEWVKKHGNTKCRMDCWIFFVRVNFEKILLKLCIGYKIHCYFTEVLAPFCKFFLQKERATLVARLNSSQSQIQLYSLILLIVVHSVVFSIDYVVMFQKCFLGF